LASIKQGKAMTLRVFLLGGVASAAVCVPAFAAEHTSFQQSLAAMPTMVASQPIAAESPAPQPAASRRVSAKHKVKLARAYPAPQPTPPAAPSALEQKVAAQQAQIALLMSKFNSTQNAAKPEPKPEKKSDQPVWSLPNGRPVVASADGRYTLAVRAVGQFDTAYYSQSAHARQLAAANGPDLSSGQNFRRVQFGIQGKVAGDWSYQFNYDFGGTATESPGRIQAAWVEYDGAAPFAVRVGAFPPAAGLEDGASASDTLFLERSASSDLARNIAGGDGRDGIAVVYAGERLYGALTYTGDKIADTGVFDEQQAVVGRVSGLAVSDDDAKLVVSANSTYVFKIADTSAGAGATRTITLSDPPELTVDDSGAKLVSTGALNAEQVLEWGLEAGGQWKNFFGQAGYFGYRVDERGGSAPSVDFSGWYAQASWVLTGEHRSYNKATAAFSNPKPNSDFSFDGKGSGAFEVAARYSDLDLNDHAGVIGQDMPVGGVRGGDQRIATLGLNWYPNSAVRFELQIQNSQVSRIGAIPAGFGHGTLNNVEVGQSFDTIALRSQIAF
jgi:phosphate-selective porin OprO/OprP